MQFFVGAVVTAGPPRHWVRFFIFCVFGCWVGSWICFFVFGRTGGRRVLRDGDFGETSRWHGWSFCPPQAPQARRGRPCAGDEDGYFRRRSGVSLRSALNEYQVPLPGGSERGSVHLGALYWALSLFCSYFSYFLIFPLISPAILRQPWSKVKVRALPAES